ncbi:CBS domain-containing protein [Rhodococcus sp. BP-149]|uniref:putative nucleotidyltransferase substrate binding domain-containing protein n=1 Tax=unclassified Rhodococcus (in: high G+C Gram-positive bacteria) TaxID=192944 RepID=UPI001C9A7435|nr:MULTISPECIES: putative nucleotidyltransferase substrate binding domain-containing protein [unclassified Rhodococcus (in: high G+C Gram-positive bacteria)]MBY6686609.1 CBS domain-containing protein [Rhodococcus sp. BP-288]MBY6695319.1 CBS domain-containing protein [Rhodococcus sp. BP-188]MBY6700101.1 CBS domain-containing protein [Rhodococcus sp. BP-285]MBY6704876.1 CBS domain-containing protein [Rhodococcus sp. BP-283]MBY6713226.1 CBS domain-containing protein [Rhodococcus sp. BP-160]
MTSSRRRSPVSALTRRGVPIGRADITVAEAADAMTRARSSTLVVQCPGSVWGVVTDGDLRRRVIAAGLSTAAPVSAVASVPAVTVDAEVPVAEAAAVALAAGVRRLVVLDASGGVLGIALEQDLLSPALRAGTALRTAVERAASVDDLVEACGRLSSVTLSLNDSRVPSADVTAVRSSVVTATVRRAAELLGDDASTWLVSGSVARRESVPSSDVETARVGGPSPMGSDVHAVLERCGLAADPHHASAASPRFVRTVDEWSDAVAGWVADPYEDTGVVMLSLALDTRPVVPGGWTPAEPARAALADAAHSRLLMLREATTIKARVTLRDKLFRRADTMDVKAGILTPIVDIARWAGVSAGHDAVGTPARLEHGARAQVLSEDDAAVLAESFDVVQRIRLRHQCEALRDGRPVDDLVRPSDLTPLDRSLLDAAAREVAGVQRASAYLAR